MSKILAKFFTGLSRKGKKEEETTCQIMLLDDTEMKVNVKSTFKGYALLERVYDHLNLAEREFFGLRYVDDTGQTHWLEANKALSAQQKNCVIPQTLYFGVKFYSADPCQLRDELTRYQFFLQVRRDVLQGRLPVTFDDAAELFGSFLQSELGDYNPRLHSTGYSSEYRFTPNQTADLEVAAEQHHAKLTGQHPADAEMLFLDKARWLEMYGADLHPVQGDSNNEFFVALTPSGVAVYEQRERVGYYYWPRVNKLTFRSKMFVLRVKDKNNEENTYAFELATKSACKHLWRCSVEHHAFFRLTQASAMKSHGQRKVLRSVRRNSSRNPNSSIRSNTSMQPTVQRTPSKRYARRPDFSSSMIDSQERVDDSRWGPQMEQMEGSPRSTRSAPWSSNRPAGGLYTGRYSPTTSVRSDVLKFPRRIESDTEGAARRLHAHRRRRNNRDSDGEMSDASYQRHRSRSGYRADTSLDDVSEAEQRPRGSMTSVQSGESRRRRRHKSPGGGSTHSRRPPEELRKHFVYGLVETDGLNTDQLQDISYKNVTMSSKYRPPRPWKNASDMSLASRHSRKSTERLVQPQAPQAQASRVSQAPIVKTKPLAQDYRDNRISDYNNRNNRTETSYNSANKENYQSYHQHNGYSSPHRQVRTDETVI